MISTHLLRDSPRRSTRDPGDAVLRWTKKMMLDRRHGRRERSRIGTVKGKEGYRVELLIRVELAPEKEEAAGFRNAGNGAGSTFQGKFAPRTDVFGDDLFDQPLDRSISMSDYANSDWWCMPVRRSPYFPERVLTSNNYLVALCVEYKCAVAEYRAICEERQARRKAGEHPPDRFLLRLDELEARCSYLLHTFDRMSSKCW